MWFRIRLIFLPSMLACLSPQHAHAQQEDHRVEDALQLATTGNFKAARALLEAVQTECEAGEDLPQCGGIDELVRTAQLWDGDFAAADKTFEKIRRAAVSAAAEEGCAPLAAIQLEQASMLMAQQRFKAAADLYRQVLNCDDASPNADFTRHQLGFALTASGQWHEAKAVLLPLYERSEAFETQDMRHGWGRSIGWMLGETYLALGDVQRARAVLQRSVRHNIDFLRVRGGDYDHMAMSIMQASQPAFKRYVESAWLLATGETREAASTGLSR